MDEPVRILEMIPIDSIVPLPNEFKKIPLYREVSEGVLEINCGVKKDHDDILLFDVSEMDDEFKAKYSEHIFEMEITEIRGEPRKKASEPQIIAVIRADAHKQLSLEEQQEIGYDFVTLSYVNGKFKVTPSLSEKRLPPNLYVKFDPSKLSRALTEKIYEVVRELSITSDGLYEDRGMLNFDSSRGGLRL